MSDRVTHRVTWTVDGVPCRFEGSEEDVQNIHWFISEISQLVRENISEVVEIKKEKTHEEG